MITLGKYKWEEKKVKLNNFMCFISQLAASPLASSVFAAIGDWKGLCPFQTSIF